MRRTDLLYLVILTRSRSRSGSNARRSAVREGRPLREPRAPGAPRRHEFQSSPREKWPGGGNPTLFEPKAAWAVAIRPRVRTFVLSSESTHGRDESWPASAEAAFQLSGSSCGVSASFFETWSVEICGFFYAWTWGWCSAAMHDTNNGYFLTCPPLVVSRPFQKLQIRDSNSIKLG